MSESKNIPSRAFDAVITDIDGQPVVKVAALVARLKLAESKPEVEQIATALETLVGVKVIAPTLEISAWGTITGKAIPRDGDPVLEAETELVELLESTQVEGLDDAATPSAFGTDIDGDEYIQALALLEEAGQLARIGGDLEYVQDLLAEAEDLTGRV